MIKKIRSRRISLMLQAVLALGMGINHDIFGEIRGQIDVQPQEAGENKLDPWAEQQREYEQQQKKRKELQKDLDPFNKITYTNVTLDDVILAYKVAKKWHSDDTWYGSFNPSMNSDSCKKTVLNKWTSKIFQMINSSDDPEQWVEASKSLKRFIAERLDDSYDARFWLNSIERKFQHEDWKKDMQRKREYKIFNHKDDEGVLKLVESEKIKDRIESNIRPLGAYQKDDDVFSILMDDLENVSADTIVSLRKKIFRLIPYLRKLDKETELPVITERIVDSLLETDQIVSRTDSKSIDYFLNQNFLNHNITPVVMMFRNPEQFLIRKLRVLSTKAKNTKAKKNTILSHNLNKEYAAIFAVAKYLRNDLCNVDRVHEELSAVKKHLRKHQIDKERY